MKCFKHLCAKLFLCLFVGSLGFTLDVSAAETTDVTGAVEVVMTPEAIMASTQAQLAAAQATLVTMQVQAVDTINVVTPTAIRAAVVQKDTTVVTQPSVAITQATPIATFTEARAQDVDRLSRVIQPEGGTFDDKVCVGLTVLHRVDSLQFPNTVEENINAPSQYTKPTKGKVLPENLLAAEYAMQLWESGMSYSVLPDGYLYFAGNGKRNRFRNAEGKHYDAPDIAQFIPYITTQGPNGALIF